MSNDTWIYRPPNLRVILNEEGIADYVESLNRWTGEWEPYHTEFSDGVPSDDMVTAALEVSK